MNSSTLGLLLGKQAIFRPAMLKCQSRGNFCQNLTVFTNLKRQLGSLIILVEKVWGRGQNIFHKSSKGNCSLKSKENMKTVFTMFKKDNTVQKSQNRLKSKLSYCCNST
jgi:hypothetical protein